MKIEIDRTLVKMIPENEQEKKELNQLWNIVIDCVRENKEIGSRRPVYPWHQEYSNI